MRAPANRRARVLALAILLAAVLAGVYALGLLIPEEAIAGSYLQAGQAPSLSHPFGTDALEAGPAAAHAQGPFHEHDGGHCGLAHQRGHRGAGGHRLGDRLPARGRGDQLGDRPCDGRAAHDPG